VKCGNWYTLDYVCTGGYYDEDVPDVLILPFDKNATWFEFELWLFIYDDDGWSSGSDTIADYRLYHTFASLQQAQSELGCGKEFSKENYSEDGTSRMYYTLTAFPNSCSQAPPYLPGDWGYY
jgi:hypothetical protein